MTFAKTTFIALVLSAAQGAASAYATEGAGPYNDPAPQTKMQTRALGNYTSATYARLAAVIYYDASAGGTQVLRSKGVSGARSPQVGLYCIRPSTISSSDVPYVVPAITVNYSRSIGTGLEAYYRQTTDCLSNEIAVYTTKFNGSSFVASRSVGFTILVP